MIRKALPAPQDLDGRGFRKGEMALIWFTPSGRGVLTDAECRVAVAITRGWSNARIARENRTTVRTVANQVASLLKKLGVSSRTGVAARFGIADIA